MSEERWTFGEYDGDCWLLPAGKISKEFNKDVERVESMTPIGTKGYLSLFDFHNKYAEYESDHHSWFTFTDPQMTR